MRQFLPVPAVFLLLFNKSIKMDLHLWKLNIFLSKVAILVPNFSYFPFRMKKIIIFA